MVSTESPASQDPGCLTELLRSPFPCLNLDALSSDDTEGSVGLSNLSVTLRCGSVNSDQVLSDEDLPPVAGWEDSRQVIWIRDISPDVQIVDISQVGRDWDSRRRVSTLIISLTCSHVSKVPCIHVSCFMVITYVANDGHSGSWKNQFFLEGGIVPFYGVNSHGEFIIVLIPPQVMMHVLYISILQLSSAATASRSICHTSGYASMCVEIQNGVHSLYYTISYSLLVGMRVVPPYDVPNLFSSYYESCQTAFDAAHKETSALLRSTQNIVRRKHHVPVHGVPSTAIIVPNYVRYDAKTSLDY